MKREDKEDAKWRESQQVPSGSLWQFTARTQTVLKQWDTAQTELFCLQIYINIGFNSEWQRDQGQSILEPRELQVIWSRDGAVDFSTL